MSKVLIDRELLERAVYRLELAYDADAPIVCDLSSVLSAPSGTPAMPVKAYYYEAPNEYGGLNKSVGLEVRKAFIDAPLVLESDALARIAEIEADRDSHQRCAIQAMAELSALKAQEPSNHARALNDALTFGIGMIELNSDGTSEHVPAESLYAAPVSEAKAQGVVMHATDGGRNPRYEGLFDGETEAHRATRLNAAPVQQVSVTDGWRSMVDRLASTVENLNEVARGQITDDMEDPDYEHGLCDKHDDLVREARAMLAAAPAAPAADAGLVEALETIINPIEAMRRELQVGEQLNGMVAMQLASDPEYLRGVAKAALATHCAKGVV